MELPASGLPADAVLEALDARRAGDADWRHGRTFSLIYNTGDEQLEQLMEAVAARFAHDNALNPSAFPSLRDMEREVVAASAALLHGEPRAGALTSGGTESILMAVKVARDVAADGRDPSRRPLNIVVPESAHPAFAKAAHTLGIDERRAPLGDDLRVDVAAMQTMVDADTALLVASAPCYPYGLIDDVPAVAELAGKLGTSCHVDACLGGWLLPFLERLGHPVSPFDFRVPGVTSLSADVHKYGYSTKGASTVLHRDRERLKRQWFLFDGWPGGIYGTPAAAGARAGAPIAAAWAAMNYLGEAGYLRLADDVWQAFDAFRSGIDAIEGLAITGDPDFPSFQFGATGTDLDIGGVADAMDDRGWHVDRQQGGLHLMLSPHHLTVVDEFLADLAAAVRGAGASRGRAATYGGVS